MNKKPDGSQSFDFNNLTLKQPTISENLTLKQPAISDDLTLEQPAIGGDWLIQLKPPTISDDLTQRFIHHLTLPDFNHSNETSR
ncbi:hypothetical protein QUA41_17550 [Microcoleus sp. Pol11C1]|uniref:hypothetical protein n=1 Tax=unclassified Microcoleus TaxID=2642155 RepID=UPI002FD0961F